MISHKIGYFSWWYKREQNIPSFLKLAFCLYHDLHTTSWVSLNLGFHPDERLYLIGVTLRWVSSSSIVHKEIHDGLHIISKKKTWVLSLYVIKSKEPSGGMKDIVLSFSKRANRTHLKQNKNVTICFQKRRHTFFKKNIKHDAVPQRKRR